MSKLDHILQEFKMMDLRINGHKKSSSGLKGRWAICDKDKFGNLINGDYDRVEARAAMVRCLLSLGCDLNQDIIDRYQHLLDHITTARSAEPGEAEKLKEGLMQTNRSNTSERCKTPSQLQARAKRARSLSPTSSGRDKLRKLNGDEWHGLGRSDMAR